MEYKLTRSKRKTLVVSISGGEVVVKAPSRMSVEHIERFLVQKSDWIRRKLDEFAQKNAALATVISGDTVLYHGAVLRIVPCYAARPSISGGVLFMPQQRYTDVRSRLSAIARLFKRVAAQELKDRLVRVSASLGLRFNRFSITNARTKWGSCDGDCNVRLNWRLVMLDDELVYYVMVHELAHTGHHDHSAAFWQLVERVMPNYKAAKKRLKAFSPLTALYR